MTKLERIKAVVNWLKERGVIKNQAELGKMLGYTNVSSLSKIMNGKTAIPSNFTYKLARLDSRINEHWISEGWDKMTNESGKKEIFNNIIVEETNSDLSDDLASETNELCKTEKRVPFWNLPVAAGQTISSTIGGYNPDGHITGLPGADIAENILPVVGVSMAPEVNPGALIGVRLINNWETLNTERIYLIITTDDRMIKRIEHDPEDEKIIWCVSPNYPRFKVYKSEILEIHRVCFVYNPK